MSSTTPILRSPDMADKRFVLQGPRHAAKSAPPAKTETGAEEVHAPSTRTQETIVREQADLEAHEAALQASRETGYKDGYKEGYETGMQTGDDEGRAAYTAGLQQLEDLAHNLDQTVERSLGEAEDMMVSIVFEAVCKIVGDSLATREGVSAVVREALARTRGKSALVIRVNPLDLELIEEGSAFGVASETDWRADDTVPMGGCIVESEYGTLDARIDTQLNQLKRTLLAARHKPAAEARHE